MVSQIILATHSPGIIMDGWEQLVTNISDLISISDQILYTYMTIFFVKVYKIQIQTYSVFEFRRFREIWLMTCRILAFFLVVSKKKRTFVAS